MKEYVEEKQTVAVLVCDSCGERQRSQYGANTFAVVPYTYEVVDQGRGRLYRDDLILCPPCVEKVADDLRERSAK
jgi:hypothetical protein